MSKNLPRFRVISLSLVVCAAARWNVKTRGGDLEVFRIYRRHVCSSFIDSSLDFTCDLDIVWLSDILLWIFSNMDFLKAMDQF